jgi:hypothetical protein
MMMGTFAEIGQHILPAPARGAKIVPFVVIVGRPTVGNHGVNAGATAEHFRLLVDPGRTGLGRVGAGHAGAGPSNQPTYKPGSETPFPDNHSRCRQGHQLN